MWQKSGDTLIVGFLIIAFVLFVIVKAINKFNEGVNEMVNGN